MGFLALIVNKIFIIIIKFGIELLNSDLASIPRFIFVSSVQFVASEPMLLLRFVASELTLLLRFVASELTLLLRFVASELTLPHRFVPSVRFVASELKLLLRFVASELTLPHRFVASELTLLQRFVALHAVRRHIYHPSTRKVVLTQMAPHKATGPLACLVMPSAYLVNFDPNTCCIPFKRAMAAKTKTKRYSAHNVATGVSFGT